MTGYKYLRELPDGTLVSPFLQQFRWRPFAWHKPVLFLWNGERYVLSDGRPYHGLYCLAKPTYYCLGSPWAEQRLAVVEGVGQMSGSGTVLQFRAMRITGWFTGNIAG